MDLEEEITHSLMLVDYERGVSQEDVIRIAQDYAREKLYPFWRKCELATGNYKDSSFLEDEIIDAFNEWWEENK